MTSRNKALQSAMEYLMTYGWAILIIAVVLGALFQLGIFNASTFTPKAPPGACHVFRPNGPMTSSFINLQGICNGELPQYVAKFDGTSSYSQLSYTPGINPSAFTISVWADVKGGQGTYRSPITSRCTSGTNTYGYMLYANYVNQWQFMTGEGIAAWGTVSGGTVTLNEWVHVVGTYSSGTVSLYLNGQSLGSATYAFSPNTGCPMRIGAGYTEGVPQFFFNGLLSNLQIYNSSLSSNEVSALYNEGIGGAPVKLNNLVGWWPLNGDAKDYSGNNYNTASSGMSFTSEWVNSYSAP